MSMLENEEELELFNQLIGVESLSVDPRLKIIFDRAAELEKELNRGTIGTEEVTEELDGMWPHVGEKVKITGEIFCPAKTETDGKIEYVTRYVSEQTVVSERFAVRTVDITDDVGMETGSKKVIGLIFLLDDEEEKPAPFVLLREKIEFMAFAEIAKIHLIPRHPSSEYIDNNVHELIPSAVGEIDDLLDKHSEDSNGFLLALEKLSLPLPKDSVAIEAYANLEKYVTERSDLDMHLPYAIAFQGRYYTDPDHYEGTETGTGYAMSSQITVLAQIKDLRLLPLLTVENKKLTDSKDLRWAVTVGVYGRKPEQDLIHTITIPVARIRSITSLRNVFTSAEDNALESK